MNLQELEERLRSLIEVHLINALPGQKPEDLLVQRLTEVLQATAKPDDQGNLVAPNIFTILAHPASITDWQKPDLLEALTDILESAAHQAHIRFDVPPGITIAEDDSLTPGDFNLIASYRANSLAQTKDMQTESQGAEENSGSEIIPENAFLIIDGVKVFQLNQPVISIGRRLDNSLVVDDPRVSRNHAQLRVIKGHFVLFDLDSSGGTFVNGQRANQTVLYPGDVISLAGVSLIFGQDNPVARPDRSTTAPRNRAGADRPTAVIHTMPRGPKKKK